MSDSETTSVKPPVSSPPPADRPPTSEVDITRARLHQVAQQLTQRQNRALMIEYLTLRRTLR